MTPNKNLARYVRTIQEMHDQGWTVDLIVEIALANRPAQAPKPDDERAAVKELYLESLPRELRP